VVSSERPSDSGSNVRGSNDSPGYRGDGSNPIQLCPHMGLPSDPETHYSFTSVGNHCHRVKPAASISFSYQKTYCLTEKYRICPVFQKSWKGDLPDGLSVRTYAKKAKKNGASGLIILVVLLLVGIASFPVLGKYLPAIIPDQTTTPSIPAVHSSTPALPTNTLPASSPTPAVPATEVVHLSLPTFTPTLPPTNTPDPTQTFTPAPPTPGPLLETPFGPQNIYIIHQVKAGESWGAIGHRYSVAADVLIAANPLRLGLGLWEGNLVVVILGESNVQDVQPLQVLYVEEDTSLQALAAEHDQDLTELRRMNALGSEDLISGGRYLILLAPK
jgi:hypothetical protein